MKLNDLIKPAIEKMGYELTDIEVKTQGREQLISIFIDNLTDTIPFFGPILFGHSIIFYFAFILPFLTNYFLKRTKYFPCKNT